jgi:hypothetical protein
VGVPAAVIVENAIQRLAPGRRGTWLETVSASLAVELDSCAYPLRFALVDATAEGIVIESTLLRYDGDGRHADALSRIELLQPRRKSFQAHPFCAVQIVPTGIRCEFGGYAGDACPVSNLLASTVDLLVTHPNAVNASELNEMAENVLYVEGKSLDDFLLGHLGLRPVVANRVGTFVDPTGSAYIDDVVNSLDAARATGGIDCGLYTVLGEELGVEIEWSERGCAVGTVRSPEAILDAVELLLAQGVDAVGGVSVIHGVTAEMFASHQRGEIPNPSGGVEAIITHLVSKLFRVPAAHSPLPYYQDLKPTTADNPRVSAELISTPHYVSVLKGLARAPGLVEISRPEHAPGQLLTVNNVGAIVAPASCLGGLPALAAEFSEIPLVAVRENATILDVTNSTMRMPNVIEVESYLEAAGVLVALREGISLESLRRPLGRTRRIDSPREHHVVFEATRSVT